MCGLFPQEDPKRRLTRDEINKFRPENIDDHRSTDPMVLNDPCAKSGDTKGITMWEPSSTAKRYPILMTKDEIWMFRRLLDQERNTDMACTLRNLKDQISALYADWKSKGI